MSYTQALMITYDVTPRARVSA